MAVLEDNSHSLRSDPGPENQQRSQQSSQMFETASSRREKLGTPKILVTIIALENCVCATTVSLLDGH